MPKRTDLKKILMIGSGPVVIGQACEFDYSGSQACRALLEEGYEVVLINSNPATIMTDPVMAHRTYVEPITAEVIEKIIARERPDAVLPTLGGQTGLNVAVFLARAGVYERYGVEVLGCDPDGIQTAEDREEFKAAMLEIGLQVPASGIAHTVDQGMDVVREIGLPVIIRPAFTLGGTGGSTAYNLEEAPELLAAGLSASPVNEVLVEQSVIGWKEIEFEVMRDCADNVIIVTSMENVDPMGVHTGDSAVVAPAQTLTTADYARYVDSCRRIIRRVGMKGGGVNVQFAGDPHSDAIVVIEVNPRLSRSSALASKATGLPIARVATKLAVGYTLDEVLNNVTGSTHTLQEPTVDYCVYKAARFTFEKFPQAARVINTSMKSVGESMSIGRTFKEAFQKGLRSLEIGRYGFGADGKDPVEPPNEQTITQKLAVPNDERIFYIRHALKAGFTVEQIHDLSRIDRWFLENFRELVELERRIGEATRAGGLRALPEELLLRAKRWGYSDRQIGALAGCREWAVRRRREELGLLPGYKLVDTCAGEVDPERPYFYSTYEQTDECRASARDKVMILGGGPNRIGQGIEFDYCCVHAALAVRDAGLEAIMVNCNPETVSTDYDTSDRLYFEPMTVEDVLNIVHAEKPRGVIVQFGGQTPLNIAGELESHGVPILGTSCASIDAAEDRKLFRQLLDDLGLKQAASGTAVSYEEALALAEKIGYPVLVRPSYVLGGRAMEIVYDAEELRHYVAEAVVASPERPILVDKFLEDAIEVDVDAVSDGRMVVIGALMEHIEEAGIHSGDSACVIPPQTLPPAICEEIARQTRALATGLNVVGLVNVQYAVRNGEVYVLEANPRASRTIPFVSKAIGVPMAQLATRVMLGRTLEELGFTEEVHVRHVAVKEAVFPFARFPGIDTQLGPEMRSTGEVMGIADDFGMAFAKAELGAGCELPVEGTVFFSLRDRDKTAKAAAAAAAFAEMGFRLCATDGTAAWLAGQGLECERVNKVREGRPHIVDRIINGEVALVINTPSGKHPRRDEVAIRSTSWARRLPIITTVRGATAACQAIARMKQCAMDVKTLQEYTIDTHGQVTAPRV
ncbi:MAG: carbamoyl-phosphate synthase large subunit [Candidatus Brocadiaceae bacterium]|nr:carbamoyl-phosphate synthase large subunit [Candidatus Brocadiaceae bacterium]